MPSDTASNDITTNKSRIIMALSASVVVDTDTMNRVAAALETTMR